MFRDLPRYSETRPTMLPWASVLPRHWRFERAKTIMRAIDVRSVSGEEELLTVSSKRGVIPRASATVSMFKSESYVGHKLCWPNDLVINSLWAWGRGLGVTRHHGIVSTAYGVYRLRNDDLDPSYLHELVRSEPFQWELQVRSQGVWKSRLQISDERWLDAPLLVPPAEEQAAIVKYLAHANARIDKAIAAKRHLITLSNEQANVQRASLLQGLGPEQRLANIVWEGPTNGISPEISESGDLQTVSISVVRGGEVDVGESDIKYVERSAVRDVGKYALRAGDVLIVRGNGNLKLVGRAGRVSVDMPDRIYPDLLMRMRFRTGIDSRFVVAVLNSPAVREQIEATCRTAVGTYKLSGADVRGLRLPVPGLDIQHMIIRELGAIDANLTQITVKLSREVDLLREFRTRLVADVVTGQIDVRAIAATLPEAPESSDNAVPALDDELEEVLGEGEG